MANSTAMEWTDDTWNPVTGCTKISAGCDHCYAERFSERFRGTPGHPFETGFDLTLRPERLQQPLAWRNPRMIFVNSMSDLFHKEIPNAFIGSVFDTLERAHCHTFQLLTKRSSLLPNFLRRRSRVTLSPSQIRLLGGRRVNMVALGDYAGREQSFVKHVLLESYPEKLVHKVASRYDQIAYVDGFAGPWLSANERFEDTSFGIALSALRRAKATWKQNSLH